MMVAVRIIVIRKITAATNGGIHQAPGTCRRCAEHIPMYICII